MFLPTKSTVPVAMPEHMRAEPDIRVFRKLLKTHLFNLAFNVH